MTAGPHIYDNALADLENELVEGHPGMLEMEQGPSNDPTAAFDMSIVGRRREALIARVGFLPSGVAFVRFTAMNVETGEPVKVHALETETGAFVDTD